MRPAVRPWTALAGKGVVVSAAAAVVAVIAAAADARAVRREMGGRGRSSVGVGRSAADVVVDRREERSSAPAVFFVAAAATSPPARARAAVAAALQRDCLAAARLDAGCMVRGAASVSLEIVFFFVSGERHNFIFSFDELRPFAFLRLLFSSLPANTKSQSARTQRERERDGRRPGPTGDGGDAGATEKARQERREKHRRRRPCFFFGGHRRLLFVRRKAVFHSSCFLIFIPARAGDAERTV